MEIRPLYFFLVRREDNLYRNLDETKINQTEQNNSNDEIPPLMQIKSAPLCYD